MKNNKNISRRSFIGAGAAFAAFTIVPRHVLGGPGKTAPSEKLNIVCIGVGGKGFDDVRNVMSENIIAICDVDTKHAADAFKMFSKAKKYSDYRRMLDKEAKNIDAVVVATPDHVHIPASTSIARSLLARTSMKYAWPPKLPGKAVWQHKWEMQLTPATTIAVFQK
ncbi:MAG: Gfo/Idh/MocA family oxidoreductase [Planctomycetota bacterium]